MGAGGERGDVVFAVALVPRLLNELLPRGQETGAHEVAQLHQETGHVSDGGAVLHAPLVVVTQNRKDRLPVLEELGEDFAKRLADETFQLQRLCSMDAMCASC